MFIEKLLDLLLPETCAVCAGPCTRGFCAGCLEALPRVADPCPACGLPTADPAHPHCRPPAGVDSVTAPFLFASPTSDLVHKLKFGRRRSLGRALGLALVDVIGHALPAVDAWVAVPLHRSRLIERGYNQAEEIARPVARAAGMPLVAGAVRRRRVTGPQTRLPAAARRRNLDGAFAVSAAFRHGRIGVVDDVITTGATIAAVAAALRAAGAESIACVAVARTVPGAERAPEDL